MPRQPASPLRCKRERIILGAESSGWVARPSPAASRCRVRPRPSLLPPIPPEAGGATGWPQQDQTACEAANGWPKQLLMARPLTGLQTGARLARPHRSESQQADGMLQCSARSFPAEGAPLDSDTGDELA